MPNGNEACMYERPRYDPAREYRFTCLIYTNAGDFVRSVGAGTSVYKLSHCIDELCAIQEMIRGQTPLKY